MENMERIRPDEAMGPLDMESIPRPEPPREPNGPRLEPPHEPDGPHDRPEPPHGPHGPRGPHPEPPHGPHGPHGPHPEPPCGPHGPRGPHPEPPPGPGLDKEQYEAMDTDGKLLAMIRALGHASRFHFDSRGAQNRALRLLKEDGAVTQRELTERLGIQPGSASELIGKLERSGLIRRAPSQTDRRTADIRLTEAGLARREAGAEREKDAAAQMFAALTEEEKNTLLSLLERLHAAWREIARPPHPGEEE